MSNTPNSNDSQPTGKPRGRRKGDGFGQLLTPVETAIAEMLTAESRGEGLGPAIEGYIKAAEESISAIREKRDSILSAARALTSGKA